MNTALGTAPTARQAQKAAFETNKLAKRLRRAGAGAEAVMQVFDETRAMCISPGTSG